MRWEWKVPTSRNSTNAETLSVSVPHERCESLRTGSRLYFPCVTDLGEVVRLLSVSLLLETSATSSSSVRKYS